MENLTRKKSKKPAQAAITMCKKHPKHHQSPGVCSLCLREKLSILPSTSSSRATTITNASSTSSSLSSLSSLSSQCSSNASSCASPMHGGHNHRRGGGVVLEEGGKGFLLSFLKSNKVVLTKSRSMATYVEERDKIDHHGMIKKKKKGGFWSKLIRSKSSNKRMMGSDQGGGLMHSRTMRDMLTTRL